MKETKKAKKPANEWLKELKSPKELVDIAGLAEPLDALKQYKKDFKRKRLEITLRELRDAYY